jgi:hypothetical protein
MGSPIQLTIRGIFVGAFGAVLGIVGVYFITQWWTRTLGVGVLLVGAGLMAMGATNGFSDYSPLGKLLYKVGLISFGIGVPLSIYAFSYGTI